MTIDELREEITFELEAIEKIIQELLSLNQDVANQQPTVREQTAAAAFLAQFYNGIEKMLKRIARYYSVPLPSGDTWHLDLFKKYCIPSQEPLPALFDKSCTLSSVQTCCASQLWLSSGMGTYARWN